MESHTVGQIAFALFGLVPIGFAVAFERYWWERRNWRNHKGTVVSSSEKASWDGGPTFAAIIEYRTGEQVVQFTSLFGSIRKPEVGGSVEIRISPDGTEACESNSLLRMCFTGFSFLAGVICFWIAATIQPTNG